MSGPAKESQPQVAGISISPEQLKRLLSKLLPTTLLGERLPLGFYAQIGFRFLALPAWADETERLSKTQQFSSLIRLDAARVLQGSIRTITDGHLTTEDILALTKRLDEPRFRLVCELFWPHLATPQFEVLRSAKELTDDTVLKMLESGASAATSAIMRKHAFAIVRHCHAINHELQNLMDRKSAVDGLWPKALALWTNVCSDQEFWIYMEERARKQDDPRLKAEDLAQAQKELPAIILGIHELLTDYYFSIDRTDDCIRHLQIIRESGFDKQAVHDSILRAVKRIALSRLDSLMQRSVAAFSDIKDSNRLEKFEAICSPFVQEAVDIQNIIVERLKIPGKYLEESAFDAIVEAIRKGANQQIEYSGGDRERALLYSSLLDKKLLKFPLSGALRHKIEESLREDRRLLYGVFYGSSNDYEDPTSCFFAAGMEADPEESLVIPMYRITNREVQVDRYQGSAGIRVSWNKSSVLIPRSKVAASTKASKFVQEIPIEQYSKEEQEIAARLKAVQRKHQMTLEKLETQLSDQVAHQNALCSAEIGEIRKREGESLVTAEAQLAEIKKKEDAEFLPIEEAAERDIKKVKISYEAPLKTAREKMEGSALKTTGTSGFLRFRLPALVFAYLFTLFGWGKPDVIMIGLALGYLGGFGIARLFRQLMTRQYESLVNKQEEECNRILQEAEVKKNEIRARFEQTRKPARVIVNQVAQQEERIRTAFNEKLAAIQKEFAEKKKAIMAQLASESEPLHKRLTSECEIKPLSRQNDFPVYQHALGRGYKRGTEPSSSEMEMTSSERAEAMIRLQRF